MGALSEGFYCFFYFGCYIIRPMLINFIDFQKWLIYFLFLISAYNYGGIFFYSVRKYGAELLDVAGYGPVFKIVLRLAAGIVIFSTAIFLVFAAQVACRISFALVLLAPILFQAFLFYRGGRCDEYLSEGLFSTGFFSGVLSGIKRYIYDITYLSVPILAVHSLAAALCVFAFVSSLVPQFGWDAMAYQLEVPKRYIQNGGLFFIEDIHFSGHPKLVNMIYSFFMMFGKDSLCSTFHFTFLIACCLAVLSFDFKKHLHPDFTGGSAGLASLLLLAHPQALVLCSWAYIDLGLMFYFTVSALCLISGNYVLCAFFLGSAACAKYTGLMIAAIFYAVVFFKIKAADPRKALYIVKLIFITALVFAPYMAANFYFTSNPFYPFFDSYMPFETVRYDHMDTYLATLERVGGGRGFIDKLLYPYDSMMNSRYHGNLYYDGVMGMTFFAMIPFFFYALYRAGRNGAPLNFNVLALAAIFALYYLFVLGAQSTRFFLAAAPVFYIISALGLKFAAENLKPAALKKTFIFLFACFLALNAWPAAVLFFSCSPMAYLKGEEAAESFLTRNLAPYHCISEFNKIYESLLDVKLMTVYEPRLYYARKNYIWRDVFEPCELEIAVHSYFDGKNAAVGSAASDFLSEKMKSAGITHILAKDRALEIAARGFDDERKSAIFKEFIKSKTKAIASGNGYGLYSINY